MRKLVVLCVVAAVLMIVAPPVAANGVAGACPDPIPGVAGGVGATIDRMPVGQVDGDLRVDRNGDGYVCWITAGSPRIEHVGPTAMMDNVIPFH